MERATSTIHANEEWRPVRDFEGLYEVSNLGQVRSLDRYVTKPSKDKRTIIKHCQSNMLKLQKHRNGYWSAQLWKDGKRYSISVHRLVAIAFIPNPDNLPEVNHKDEDKANNSSANLEWCDHAYNLKQGTVHERICASRKRLPIEQLTLDGQHVAYFDSARQAERITNFRQSKIWYALNGKIKTAYGYQWRYI